MPPHLVPPNNARPASVPPQKGRRLKALVGPALLLLCLCSCGHGRHTAAATRPGRVAAGTPGTGEGMVVGGAAERTLDSQEEADIARQDLDYVTMSEDAAARAALQRGLLHFYAAQGQGALSRGHQEEAYELFLSGLGLFDARDLMDPAHPPVAPELLTLAQGLDKAFRRRGAHAEVITALLVEETLSPGDEAPRRRYRELAGWLGDGEALIHDLEQGVKAWPAAAAVQELGTRYRSETQPFGPGAPRLQSPRDLLNFAMRRQGPGAAPAFKLARLYLRVSRPQEAVQAIQQLGTPGRDERALIGLIQAAVAPGATPTDAMRLAALFSQNPEDLDVSLQVCRDILRRHKGFLQADLCVGELGVQLQRKGLSLRAFEQARDLAPGDKIIWEKLSRLYQERLRDLVGDERTGELTEALQRIERFQARMHKQFPQDPMADNMAGPLAEVGRGYYNAGHIDDAVRFLDRSIAVEPNATALELLGTIHLKRNQAREALSALERARAVELSARQGEALVKVYFKAHIGRLIAEALDLQDEPDGKTRRAATELRKSCLRDWEQILEVEQLPPERRAEAEVERGKLYYRLGERAEALSAFQRAIAAVPPEGNGDGNNDASRDQGQVYADTIAFLVQQGELSEAMDAYHRALSRARVVEYLKVYCSLWVNDLSRRAGQPEDPLATAFLRSVTGGKWYAELARWATGQEGQEALLKRAETVGQKAEANFYLGMWQLQLGNREKGEALLRNVLHSEMMAFFEYEMAANYLRHGAPASPLLKSQPATHGPGGGKKGAGKSQKRPPGSI